MANKSKTVINLEYAGARVGLGLMGLLPRSVAVHLGIFFIKTASYVLRRVRKTGMRNLEIAYPEKTAAERKQILDGTFENLGRVLGEVSQLGKYSARDLARMVDFDVETAALYQEHKAGGGGAVLATGHMGNWEMLVFAFSALYDPISYMARPLDNPKIESMLTKLRTRFGNTPINKNNSANLAISVLRNGGSLGILSDVNAHERVGVFVPFFGVPACTPVGAAIMAIRSNSFIFPVVCVWEKTTARYKLIHGKRIAPSNTGDRKRDIVETTAAYTAELEKMIRQYPEQWMWIHKRWKTRPPGEPDLY